MSTFTCAVCGGTYTTPPGAEVEANKEFLESGMVATSASDELLSACDTCYEKVMARYRVLLQAADAIRSHRERGDGACVCDWEPDPVKTAIGYDHAVHVAQAVLAVAMREQP